METVVNGVTLASPVTTADETARRNIDTIIEFFSLYLKDKARFYRLWVADAPEVVTPYATEDVKNCAVTVHSGWDAVRAFWDPIHDEMHGRFDWFIDEIIPGADPDTIVTRSHSDIDVRTGAYWGNKQLCYQGRYVQIFRFRDGKVASFEEYYDTAQLNAVYGG
ncbi:nuclear transport factor 2 family protein [Amycolatopsis sp.]|uniref:nuclear transport factor 2 family protein n=1 Tax=Amycolatopsis sp. TaxID=37632 RepID=UPI002D051492|nr:nuclear transport factor 2 family protein [Amycolatopsis sp.]HVV09272.1 nuclear transport factor 2 family protein [Amycolatopsis sp.]